MRYDEFNDNYENISEDFKEAIKNAKGDEVISIPSVKYDQGKLRWDLLPFKEVEEIVEVLTYGVEKYEENAWQNVPEGEKRYLAATYRHLVAYSKGELKDEESGISHLAHACTNMLFLMYFQNEKEKNNGNIESK